MEGPELAFYTRPMIYIVEHQHWLGPPPPLLLLPKEQYIFFILPINNFFVVVFK